MASLHKAISVLEVVADDPRGITAKNISSRLQLPLTTTYRLLGVLINAGYVIHLREKRRYALGFRLHRLGASMHRQLDPPVSVTRLITRLHIEADAAAYYAVHRGGDIALAHVVDSPERPRIASMGVGFHGRGHATAFGKILLAAMTGPEQARYLARHGTAALTPATIHSEAELRRELDGVRETGLAVDREEFSTGTCCMAAPVFDPADRTAGSVAVSVDAGEFDGRRPGLDRFLRSVAHEVTAALRSQPPSGQRPTAAEASARGTAANK